MPVVILSPVENFGDHPLRLKEEMGLSTFLMYKMSMEGVGGQKKQKT